MLKNYFAKRSTVSDIEREFLLEEIRKVVNTASGNRLTRKQFFEASGLKTSDLFRHFPRWSDALIAAGFTFDAYNAKISPDDLLSDWASLVREFRRIPTRNEYKLQGSYSPGVFERNFGPWSLIPSKFREFADENPEWIDVIALLPAEKVIQGTNSTVDIAPRSTVTSRHTKLSNRPTYGDPIDFRGLRHAPVNENGVIFLFGIVAKELGYHVEAVQVGFPDCEAKRQIAPGQWQRVRIEFEYQSRNFLAHGHSVNGCDLIVCWIHNWADCPSSLEVVELRNIIQQLADSDD
jgi:hypothetical protein